MKTIRQLADEIGVSKQTLQKRMSREPLSTCLYGHLHTKGQTKYIDVDGENLIKSAYQKSNIEKTMDMSIGTLTQSQVHETINVDSFINFLQKEIDAKNRHLENKDDQIAEKDRQIEILQKSLLETTSALHEAQATANAAQALHAGTIQGQITEKSNQASPPITPEPKSAAAAPAPRPAASPKRKRPRNAPRPANRGKGLFDWISKRI